MQITFLGVPSCPLNPSVLNGTFVTPKWEFSGGFGSEGVVETGYRVPFTPDGIPSPGTPVKRGGSFWTQPPKPPKPPKARKTRLEMAIIFKLGGSKCSKPESGHTGGFGPSPQTLQGHPPHQPRYHKRSPADGIPSGLTVCMLFWVGVGQLYTRHTPPRGGGQ